MGLQPAREPCTAHLPRYHHSHVDELPLPQPLPAELGSSLAPPPAPLPDHLRLSFTPQRSTLPAETGLSSTPPPATLPPGPCPAGSVSEPVLHALPSSHTSSEVPLAQPPWMPRPVRRERKRGRKTAASAAPSPDRFTPAGLPTAQPAPSGSPGLSPLFSSPLQLQLPPAPRGTLGAPYLVP